MPREYAVAISYAGADRTLVHTIANYLNNALARLDGTVFLDLYNRIDFIGKVDTALAKVYRESCDLAVVFQSREYFTSKWCRLEWEILRGFMLSGAAVPKVLLFNVDGFEGEHIDGYVTVDTKKYEAAELARIILEKMNVTPWIADARYALKTLTAMKGDRVDWKFEPALREAATGTVHAGAAGGEWVPAQLAELCRGRALDWSGNSQLPRNIICCCGPQGAGKSVMLLRAVASAGQHEVFPDNSYIVDFSNNKDVCKKVSELETLPASELKRFLQKKIASDGDGQSRHLFLAIDGLDSAARHLSVRTNEMTAPRLMLKVLRSLTAKLRELSAEVAAPLTITLVVTLNAPRPTAAPESEETDSWDQLYQQLERSGALFADLELLPPVDATSFESLYDSKLKLRDGGAKAAARYLAQGREFLRLPLFLDAASWLSAGQLKAAARRADFLLTAQAEGRGNAWPNELDDLLKDLVQFKKAVPDGLTGKHGPWLRSMLQREWTGAWTDLLTEAMANLSVSGGMQQLLASLLEKECRWDLSASFALSNVITALCEARKAPRLDGEVRYYNLQRATLDGTVFGRQSVLVGVDCSGSSLKEVTLENGCRFIATDFTMCTWDKRPAADSPTFVECSGL